MPDQVYNNLPNDLISIIAHQEIRNDLLKTLSFDIVEAKSMAKVDEATRNNLNTKCHSLLEEWLASKNPKLLGQITFAETSGRAAKVIDNILRSNEGSLAMIFATLNEEAYGFQLEMEKKYAK